MKSYKALIATALIATACCISVNVSAKNKCVQKLYAFGFAASFNDSTVYFTDIQEIDSAWVNEKNEFLVGRDNYSFQLKNHLTNIGLEHRTCVISYAIKRKDIEKKYRKMKEKYVKAGNFIIKYIENKDFHFTAIKPDE